MTDKKKLASSLLWPCLSMLLAFKTVDLTLEKDKIQIKLERAEAQVESNFGLAGVECMKE